MIMHASWLDVQPHAGPVVPHSRRALSAREDRLRDMQMQLTDVLIKNIAAYGETAPATIAACREFAGVTLALLGDDERTRRVAS